MPPATPEPTASDYLALFAQYRGGDAPLDFGDAYLAPEDERYRLLFEQVCHLLRYTSVFNRAMPQEFRQTARLYLRGDTAIVARMRRPEMRHFMLSDLYDYVYLCSRIGQFR